MSEFKRAMALSAATATLGIGALVVEQDMSREYRADVRACEIEFKGDDEAECKARLGSDSSSLIEFVGYAAIIATGFGLRRAFDAQQDPRPRTTQQNEQQLVEFTPY